MSFVRFAQLPEMFLERRVTLLTVKIILCVFILLYKVDPGAGQYDDIISTM